MCEFLTGSSAQTTDPSLLLMRHPIGRYTQKLQISYKSCSTSQSSLVKKYYHLHLQYQEQLYNQKMASKINTILISILTILTFYIIGVSLFSSWFGPSQDCQYNIGCYTVSHSINRADSVIAKISDIQHQQNITKIKTQLQPLPITDADNFQNKSIQLALSFEKFIKKLTQQHDYNIENIHIYREVAKAQKQYMACKENIDQSYSESDCSENWKEYKNCSTRMQKVRFKLERLTDQEKTIRQQIAEVIKMPNNSISALELAKRIYNDSMKFNEQHKNELTAQLIPLQKTLRTNTFERDGALQKYAFTLNSFKECQQNKKKHDACEQISKEVRNINSQNIAYLKVMMQSKELLLKNLQRILDSQKNSKEIEDLNDKYLKHKEEYIIMLKEFISLTRQNEKACGCTSQLQIELNRELQQLKHRAASLNLEIRGLQLNIEKINDDLKKCEEDREEIVKTYKRALQLNQPGPTPLESELKKINRSMKSKYDEVLDLQGVYKGITKECEAIKARMSKRVHEIGAINDCVAKKNYYLELKKQTAQYIHSDYDELNRMLDSKKELAYYLKSFGPQ